MSFLSRRVRRGLLIGSALLIMALGTLMTGDAPGAVEYALLDFQFALTRTLVAPEPPLEAVRLAISRESEQRLGRPFNDAWREWYPDLVSMLIDAGASALVWDATFVASNSRFDEQLADAFRSIPTIAAEDATSRNNRVIAPSLAAVGWKGLITSANSVPRRTPDESPLPALGSIVAGLADPNAPLTSARSANNRNRRTINGSGLWLDFSLNPFRVPTVDIASVLLGDGNRLADEFATPISLLSGKVVFVGLDMPGEDRFPMPGSRGLPAPGVLAHIVSSWSHLAGRPIVRPGVWLTRLLALLPGAGALLAGVCLRRRSRRIVMALSIVVAVFLPPVLFASLRLWLPWGAMLLLVASGTLFVAMDHRITLSRSYRTSLGFDPALLEEHQRAVEGLASGVEREATVLCADIRNYTQFVTDERPDEVQAVMTQYMAAMEELVHTNGGYINKFVGDEIIAVFGFPLDEEASTQRATRCAAEMLERIVELNAEWSVAALPVLDGIGIGVDSGGLRFTNIGGARRVQFDVIGGAVNGASRIQGLTKQMERSLILSAEVAEAQSVFPVEAAPGDGAASAGTSGSPGEAGLTFIGEVMIRGQGRRRLFGMDGEGRP